MANPGDAATAGQTTLEGVQASVQGGAGSSLGTFTWSGYLEAVGVLFFFLALLWLLVWLVRRFGRFNFMPRPGALPRGALAMEAQMPLGPRKGLMVVRFLNRRLLLAVTDQQITLLSEEKAEHEPHADFEKIMEAASRGPAGSGTGSSSA